MLKNIAMVFLILAIFLINFQTSTYAYEEIKLAAVIDPSDYDPGTLEDALEEAERVVEIGATLVAIIRVIGIIVTVIALMLIGIKYMTGSVEEKADYKKTMIPYLIGVFVFFALSQLIPILIDIGSSLNA